MAGGTGKIAGKLPVIPKEEMQDAEAERFYVDNLNFCRTSVRRSECPGTPLRVCQEEGVDRGPLLGEEVQSSH